MKNPHLKALGALILSSALFLTPSCANRNSFSVVVLGCEGGLAEGNLSSYLVSHSGSGAYLALDAGTVLQGLRVAQKRGSLKDCQPPKDSPWNAEGWVLREGIKAYAISHAHIDHVAGLVIDSTDDSAKPLVGLEPTIDYLRDHLFNWKTWPNFGSEGPRPMNKYTYTRVAPQDSYNVPGTDLAVQAFPLSHSDGYPSTAFIVKSGEEVLVYCGDTGPDQVEHTDCLQNLWTALAAPIKAGRVHGIILEVSYPDGRKDSELFGHLTPQWMMKELHNLASRVDPANPGKALRGLKVLVTHIKPSLQSNPVPRELIIKQLNEQNDLGVKFIFPEQGERLEL